MGIILSEQKGNSGIVKADRGGKIPKTNDMGKNYWEKCTIMDAKEAFVFDTYTKVLREC